MAEALRSASWYRVAGLRPRLRAHAQVHRHVYRGEVWYVLQDHATGRFHRFTPEANLLIGLMDGRRTLQEIWELAATRLGSALPPQDEVIRLLGNLHRADVLLTDAPPDPEEMQRRRRQHRRLRIKQYIGNPLSLRLPLYDPHRLLGTLVGVLRPLLGRWGALLWLAVVATGVVLAAMHWRPLTAGVLDRVFSLEGLLLMWLAFPVVKLLHELAHGVATRAAGGEVHEMGVMLLLLVPIPYVDASAASAFPSRTARALTGAAGMMAELFVAGLAMIAWTLLEPGLARAFAFNVMLIAGVSTLVFNGNPLLRFDGYYILADLLEIPNFAQRANEYVGHLVMRHAFGLASSEPPRLAPGERGWLLGYAVASFAYRMFVMATIALLLAGQLFVVGVVLAAWCVWSMALLPALKLLQALVAGPRLRARRQRALLVSGGAAALVAVLLFGVPVPATTRTEGVIWAPASTQVRAATDGVVTRLVAPPHARVQAGDVLIETVDPELEARHRVALAEFQEQQARLATAQTQGRLQAALVQEQFEHARATLALAERRLQQLRLRSPSAGVFVLQDAAVDQPGRFFHRGELVAFVIAPDANVVRVVVPQAAAEQVRHHTQRVQVRMADRVDRILEARIAREVPAATDELPSLSLSLQGGGRISLNPGSPQDPRAIEKLFVLDLELPAGVELPYLGSRVHVRFEHPPAPLGQQWLDGLRRLFLTRFHV